MYFVKKVNKIYILCQKLEKSMLLVILIIIRTWAIKILIKKILFKKLSKKP